MSPAWALERIRTSPLCVGMSPVTASLAVGLKRQMQYSADDEARILRRIDVGSEGDVNSEETCRRGFVEDYV